MTFGYLMTLISILLCNEKGSALQCYQCYQNSIYSQYPCMEGHCGLTAATCSSNETACFIAAYLEGYWDNTNFRRGCTDDPDKFCENLKKTKYIASSCFVCNEDKCNYKHAYDKS
ncbi:hypothetical protein WA026_009435 [Henosepilachna vigintioctopunctata]|uniref:Uncharacterized protein n=1 Tax=Henosepilachna vigintioctopunctata TaxID=420089 RepID=A0AAW1TVP0_9CUCU